jgi:hypothetical protein
LKINIDSFNIRYTNIKLACPKVTMNKKKNVSPQKKVGGGGTNNAKVQAKSEIRESHFMLPGV